MQHMNRDYVALVQEHARKAEFASSISERGTHQELAEIYRARANLLHDLPPSSSPPEHDEHAE